MVSIRNDLSQVCTFCGAPMTLELLEERECEMCHMRSYSKECCSNGHFVCDACRRKAASKMIYDHCIATDSKDPIEIALEMMGDKTMHMHDLKHHTLVGAALLAAYKNSGGDIDLDAALRDMDKRGSWFPGGICGLAGTCGAAASVGAFYSIITKTSPHSEQTWSDTTLLVSKCLFEIGSINGPRCCKRNSFIAIMTASDYVEEKLGVKMDTSKTVSCKYTKRNEECIKERCPFYK